MSIDVAWVSVGRFPVVLAIVSVDILWVSVGWVPVVSVIVSLELSVYVTVAQI